jgi:hypothetical protein
VTSTTSGGTTQVSCSTCTITIGTSTYSANGTFSFPSS